jgi:nucleotide-binding universal stress UspA family protein
VLFAGRLTRHLSAEATLLSILPPNTRDPELQKRVERFLESGVRSLNLMGVPARTVIRSGAVAEEIRKETSEGGYDLVVLGAPLPPSGEKFSLNGVVGQAVSQLTDCAVLIVRSHHGWNSDSNRVDKR